MSSDGFAPRVLTAAEAARYLATDVKTLRVRVQRGHIPARRIGFGHGRLVFLKDELDRFLDALPKSTDPV